MRQLRILSYCNTCCAKSLRDPKHHPSTIQNPLACPFRMPGVQTRSHPLRGIRPVCICGSKLGRSQSGTFLRLQHSNGTTSGSRIFTRRMQDECVQDFWGTLLASPTSFTKEHEPSALPLKAQRDLQSDRSKGPGRSLLRRVRKR